MARVRIERKTDWTVRRANADDSAKIKLFYKQNTWKSKDPEIIYAWKYANNPFGKALMLVGTNSSQNVISNAVFMPWLFKINKDIINATQSVDGVTQLEYRGQGLGFEQFNRGIAIGKEGGGILCFAFPNEAGVNFHKRNNGLHLGIILRYTKPLQTEYLFSKRVKSIPLLKLLSSIGNIFLRICSKDTYCLNVHGFSVERVNNCGREFDELWDSFTNQYTDKLITVKDGKYLNWKYINSPNKDRDLYALKKNGKLYGFVVLEATPRIGYIVDILALDKATLDHLIAYSVKHFREENKDSVVFAALENNMYFRDFEKFGFVKRPEQKHFYIYIDENTKNRDLFLDSKNWFITIGDCDIEGL